MRKSHYSEARIPIAPILADLTNQSIPDAGAGWTRIHCPFHEDRTASAAINGEFQMFVCHSCGRSGDAIKLLRQELGLSFVEAKDRAEYITGEQFDKQTKKVRRRISDILKSGQQ